MPGAICPGRRLGTRGWLILPGASSVVVTLLLGHVNSFHENANLFPGWAYFFVATA